MRPDRKPAEEVDTSIDAQISYVDALLEDARDGGFGHPHGHEASGLPLLEAVAESLFRMKDLER